MPVETKSPDFKRHVTERIDVALRELGVDVPAPGLVTPPREDLGDLALPCFPFAKALQKSPAAVAEDLAERIPPDSVIETAKAEGPYVNVTVRTSVLADAALSASSTEGAPASNRGRLLIEFSSPNTNKPQHLGHLRNNLLGESVSRVLSAAGYEVTKVNLINDRGIHICKSMLAYTKFGEGETPQSVGVKGDKFVGEYYVRFDAAMREEYAEWLESEAAQAAFEAWKASPAGKTAEAKRQKAIEKAEKKGVTADPPSLWKTFTSEYKDPYFNAESALGAETRQMLVDWEAGKNDVKNLWRTMNSWVYEGFNATYGRLGVSFDYIDYESQTYLLGKQIVERGLERGVFYRAGNGAVMFDLTEIGLKGEKVVLREDGTSVYITQDLGNAYTRFEKFGAQKMVYVVADEQRYHFEVLFGVLATLNPDLRDCCHHLAYGMVNLPEGKMKSREGTVVDADDLLDELRAMALSETAERWPDLPDDERLRRAEVIGQAALKYFILNVSPTTSMVFDPKKSLDFNGNTGPYCLYAFARARSIFEKAGEDFDAFAAPESFSKLATREEHALLMALHHFDEAVARAAEDYDPSQVVRAVYAVAKAFSAFYFDRDKHPIVTCEDAALRRERLALTRAVGRKLERGLTLLSIETLDQM